MRLTPIAARPRPIAPPSPAALPEPSVPPSPAAGQGAQTDLTQLPLPLSIASQIPPAPGSRNAYPASRGSRSRQPQKAITMRLMTGTIRQAAMTATMTGAETALHRAACAGMTAAAAKP